MRTFLFLIAPFSLALLSACGENPGCEEVKTVDWWKEHHEEREAKLEECRNNPGQLRDTSNCTNAEQADFVKWTTKKDTRAVELIFDKKGYHVAEEVKTVDWWKEHHEERDAKLEECRNNPGQLRDTSNCTNAERALHSW